ncbi:MAG: hypothetical protein EB121_01330, partial [Alphaproteobacteria bacterium]|nr:hypothetical protein [Alphaproteobacteria bacterium]
RRIEHVKSPLTVLYQVLCNAVFEDEHGANQTTYNALMILGASIDKDVADSVNKKLREEDGRYKYEE